MSGSKPPKPKKINPFEGVASDNRVNEARKALGMDKINSDRDMRKINEWLDKDNYERAYKDEYFYKAQNDIAGSQLDYSDKQSFNVYYRSQGNNQNQIDRYNREMLRKHGTEDWHLLEQEWSPDASQLSQINSRAYDYKLSADSQAQNDMLIQQAEDYAAEQTALMDQQTKDLRIQSKADKKAARKLTAKNNKKAKQLAHQTRVSNEKMAADSIIANETLAAQQTADLIARDERAQAATDKAAADQRTFMEEMMDQPVYMPKQQAMPSVQAPRPDDMDMLPAPSPNTPMSIAAPPPPEMATANNRMAIVKTPRSTKSRQRRATRGTSRLTN